MTSVHQSASKSVFELARIASASELLAHKTYCDDAQFLPSEAVSKQAEFGGVKTASKLLISFGLGNIAKYNYQNDPKNALSDPVLAQQVSDERHETQISFVRDLAKRTGQSQDQRIKQIEGKLWAYALQSAAKLALPKSRTAMCKRSRSSIMLPVGVMLHTHDDGCNAYYDNLQTCTSVWTCPVCARKISVPRRQELITAQKQHIDQDGGSIDLLTLTVPHYFNNDLSEILKKQAKALTRFWSDKTVKKIFEKYKVIGQVRALEVTNGRKSKNNGWHPHYHIIIFGYGTNLISQSARDEIQHDLYLRWANACKLATLNIPSEEHGLRFDGGAKAAKYITKWSFELTDGHMKEAKFGGETPWDLLRSIVKTKGEDRQAIVLFREFAEAFQGKRQLHWSRRLKDHFHLNDIDDDDLAGDGEDDECVGSICFDDWCKILQYDLRATILVLAESNNWSDVQTYIDSLK